jgi:uncharacterized protein
MVRRDWLLLLVSLGEGESGLDPIRLQKGLFLLAQEGCLPRAECYDFRPYNYGPMSSGVYRDVEVLERRGLLERREAEGRTWRWVHATQSGRERSRALQQALEQHNPRALASLRDIRALLDRLGFVELLATIYRRYPEYAERSVFRRT